jgi:hypothetical protein
MKTVPEIMEGGEELNIVRLEKILRILKSLRSAIIDYHTGSLQESFGRVL